MCLGETLQVSPAGEHVLHRERPRAHRARGGRLLPAALHPKEPEEDGLLPLQRPRRPKLKPVGARAFIVRSGGTISTRLRTARLTVP